MSEEPDDLIVEKFEAFAKAYKYDTTVVCESLADFGEYKHESTQRAFIAFKDGFESSSKLVDKMRIALEAVRAYGSNGQTEDGVSVSYLVKDALKA